MDFIILDRISDSCSDMSMSIVDNYRRIREDIDKAAASAGRNGANVTIISVSKTFPESAVQEAIDGGIRVFGESRIQEAKRKMPLLKGDFTFHMVGHLQSNKAKDAVALFDVIHSIDKLSTAEQINREAEKIGKVQKILVQVNISGEGTKSGVRGEDCVNCIMQIADLKSVEVLGLMTMAPYTSDESIIRSTFRGAKNLLDEINSTLHFQLRELSMGMSLDYRIAVEEGATMVRIGTALFGERGIA